MRHYDLASLQMFVDVCETGKASGAAERSNVVTSAVSKRLAQLEAQAGTPLLSRKRYGMVPTIAGQTLLAHARLLLHTADQLDHELKAQASGGQGQVRLLASVSSMMGPLVPDIASFLRHHPKISVDLEEASTPQVVEGVRQGLATLGVGWNVGDLAELEGVPYRSDELCVVMPSDHALARRNKVRFAELLAYELVAQPPTSSIQILMRQLAGKCGLPFRQRVVVHSYDAALRVVDAGLAIGIVPRTVAQVTGAALGLTQVTLDEPWAIREFIVCHRGEATLTPAGRLLLEHLRTLAES